MSNNIKNKFKKALAFILAGFLTIGGKTQLTIASTNYRIEDTTDNHSDLDFEKYIEEQFKKDTLHLEGEVGRCIDSIVIHGHNVSIRLKSGNIYSKDFDKISIENMTLRSLQLLNLLDNSYIREKDKFYNISNVKVEEEFKANNDCIDPEDVNLEGCKKIWLHNWIINQNTSSSWMRMFNQQNKTTDLVLTNTTFYSGHKEPCTLAFNGTNLQKFVFTGYNPEVIDIFISNPENLKYTVFGDGTSIENLFTLKNANDLEYFSTGINLTNEMFETMSFDDFFKKIEQNGRLYHYNCINNPNALENKKLKYFDLTSFNYCDPKDIISIIETNPIDLVDNGKSSLYFGKEFTEFLKRQSNAENENILPDDFWKKIDNIRLDKNKTDFEKVKNVIIEYVKVNKSTLSRFTEKDCFNIIALLNGIGINAYCFNSFDSANLHSEFNMVIPLDSGYTYLDTSKISTNLGDIYSTEYLNKYWNETTKDVGDVISKYWEFLVEDALSNSDFLSYAFNKKDKFYIPGTIMPYTHKANLGKQIEKDAQSTPTSEILPTVSYQKQKNVLKQNKESGFRRELAFNINLTQAGNKCLSPKNKQAIYNTSHKIGKNPNVRSKSR